VTVGARRAKHEAPRRWPSSSVIAWRGYSGCGGKEKSPGTTGAQDCRLSIQPQRLDGAQNIQRIGHPPSAARLQRAVRARATLGLMRGCPHQPRAPLRPSSTKRASSNALALALTKPRLIPWREPPRCPTLPAMHPDRADNERWKPELLSFAQVRAELLAVVMANHPEFTLEEAERMLREAGF
jgi:hypothetical protein